MFFVRIERFRQVVVFFPVVAYVSLVGPTDHRRDLVYCKGCEGKLVSQSEKCEAHKQKTTRTTTSNSSRVKSYPIFGAGSFCLL